MTRRKRSLSRSSLVEGRADAAMVVLGMRVARRVWCVAKKQQVGWSEEGACGGVWGARKRNASGGFLPVLVEGVEKLVK